MNTLCGLNCCTSCPRLADCGGCEACGGHPFGGECAAVTVAQTGGPEALAREKQTIIAELHALGIPGLRLTDLNLLNGGYVNLTYPLPGGGMARFLRGNDVYWGNQIEVPGSERCYGVVANAQFLLVCTYGCNGADPELVCYRKREGAEGHA